MAQIANFTINISDIEAKLESLAARRKAAASANQPPPSIGLPTPPSTKSFSADPNKAIADIARVQGIALAASRQLRAENKISQAEFTAANKAIKAESAAALGNNTLAGPASGIGVGGKIESLEQGKLFQTISNQTLAEATRIYKSTQSQAEIQQQIEALLKQEQAIQSADNELASRGLLSRQENAQLAADRAKAVRAQISKLQEGAGLTPDGGPANATTPELIALRDQMAGAEKAQAAAAARAANEAQRYAEEKLRRDTYLTSDDPTKSRPTSDLRNDARAEARDMALNRQIAVAFGKAKQEEYLLQIRKNQAFREDYAKEQAFRQARLAIQESLIAKELLATQPDGTRLIDDKAGAKIDNAKVGAELDTLTANSKEYTDALAKSARAHAVEAAAVTEQNSRSSEYINAKATTARATAREAALISDQNSRSSEYINNKALSARAAAREAAKVAEQNAAIDDYIADKARAAAAAAKEAAGIAEAAALNQTAIADKARTVAANAAEQASITTLTAQNSAVAASKATTARNAAIEAATIAESNATNPAYIAAKAQSARALAIESAGVLTANAADPAYIAAKAQAARAHTIESLNTLRQTTQQDITNQAELASTRTNIETQRRITTLQLQSSESALALKAQERVLQREYNAALNNRIADQLAASGASRLEVAQARQGHGTGVGGGPQDAGGLFGGGLLNTVKYAVPSILLFGAASGLAESIKAAQELQLIFAQLEAQAEALGKSSGLETMKTEILGIAAESGYASTEVANLAFQFQGAFGGDTQKTMRETNAAVQAVVVTGLTLTETIDAFTAITQSFKSTDVSIEDVTDTALGLQGRFGVLAKETISFAADLAPVGAQIGLTVRELETLGAVAQKYSGRSGSELAEAFGRILPSLQKNAVDIIQIFEGLDGGAVADELSKAFATGQTGDAFQSLIKSYNDLDEAQQNQIISQLGGRREAAALIPILENSKEYFDSLNNSQDDAGKSAEYYAKAQETLSRQVAQLSETLKQLAVTLFQGGLGQSLGFLAEGAGGLVAIFNGLMGPITSFNDTMKGVPGTILGTVVALKLLAGALTIAQGAFSSLGVSGGAAGATGFLSRFQRTATVAAGASTTAAATTALTQATNSAGNIYVPAPGSPTVGRQGIIYGVQPNTNPLPTGGVNDLTGASAQAAGPVRRFGQAARSAANSLGGLAIAGAVLAVGNLVSTINELRAGAEKQVQGLEQNVLAGSTAEERQRQIDALRKAGEEYSFSDRVAQIGGFGTSPEAAADRIEAKSRAGGNAAGLQALLDQGGDAADNAKISAGGDEALQQLINKVKNGTATDEEYEQVRTILEDVKEFDDVLYNDVLKPKMDEAQKTADTTQAELDASKKRAAEAVNSLAGLDVAGIKSAVASGDASLGQAIATLNKDISTYEDLLKNDPKALANIENAAKDYQDAKKAKADILSNAAYQEANNLLDLNVLGSSTEGETSQFEIETLERVLASGRLNPADSTDAVEKLLTAKKALVNYKAEQAEAMGNTAEVLRLQTEGEALTVDAQIVLAANAIQSNTAFIDYTSGVDPLVAEILSEGGTAIATLIETQGLNLREATIEFLFQEAGINKARARTLELKAAADRALAQSAAEANVDAKEKLKTGDITPEEAEKRQKESDAANAAEQSNKDAADEFNRAADEAYREAGDLLAGEGGEGLDQFNADSTTAMVRADKKKVEDAKKSRDGWYDYLRALAADNPVLVAEIDVQEAQANLAASTAEDYHTNLAALINAQRGVRDAMRAVSAAYGEYLSQLVSDDPVASAQQNVANAQRALAEAEPNTAAYYQAASALDQAYKAQRDAQQAVLDAQDDYAAALVSGDPVKAAQQAQRTADRHLAEANNEAERLQAMAEKLSADRAMQEALQAIYDAQANLLTAAAEYVGDTVRASEIGLAETQRKLREVEAKYARGEAGEADVIQAKADVIRATGAARDALIAKKRDDYAFQYEMGQITKSQYIQYLESLKGLADGNQQIIRDLDRQIKQLKDELGADLQFNLPTNLTLPTLYEARRLNQSVGPDGNPAGYQDNRVVDINIIVNNGMDVQQLQQVLGDALGGQRFGNQARRY